MREQKTLYEILGAERLRLTKTRRVFADLFLRDETPLSATDILDEFGRLRQAVNKTTVYREIGRWLDLGIIREVQFGDRQRRYELVARGHHHHLVCVECECVEDVDIDERSLLCQEKKVSREKGFDILRHSLEFFGVCGKCQTVR